MHTLTHTDYCDTSTQLRFFITILIGHLDVKNCIAGLQVYNQIYNTTVAGNGGATALNYTSPLLHTVVLSNLKPGTEYFYQVGDGVTYSGIYNFTALAAPSKSPPSALQAQQHCCMHPSHI